jgi:hypothetical protein
MNYVFPYHNSDDVKSNINNYHTFNGIDNTCNSCSSNVNAPERVDGDFSVVIEIANAVDLDSGQFDLYFDPAAVNVTGVDDGLIDDTVIPIDNWAVDKDKIRVLFNLPGIDGVSGSGSLATIHFETIVPGDCAMEISDGLLVNNMAEKMPASWDGVESVVPKTATKNICDRCACGSISRVQERIIKEVNNENNIRNLLRADSSCSVQRTGIGRL